MMQSHPISHNAFESTESGYETPSSTRPLSLSQFVRNELPELLERVRGGVESVDRLVSLVKERCTKDSFAAEVNAIRDMLPAQQRLALLDLTMVQSAIELSGGSVPQPLADAISGVARNMNALPVLTYGLIVRDNPTSDCRTFCRGGVGEVERTFYLWPRKDRAAAAT